MDISTNGHEFSLSTEITYVTHFQIQRLIHNNSWFANTFIAVSPYHFLLTVLSKFSTKKADSPPAFAYTDTQEARIQENRAYNDSRTSSPSDPQGPLTKRHWLPRCRQASQLHLTQSLPPRTFSYCMTYFQYMYMCKCAQTYKSVILS